MNTEEILQGNKLIAEFMGATYRSKYGFPEQMGYEFKNIMPYSKTDIHNNATWYRSDVLDFHSDWNWLMPVAKKIKDLPTPRSKKYMQMSACQSIMMFEIKTAFFAIVNFIQWYNTQSK